ncbi:MAG: hypothetical protein H6817_07340 [Phycisphaerales bacterium]|nr:hypothetical protein [Phycisphaerales bacterium]
MSRPWLAATRSRARMLRDYVVEIARNGTPVESGDPSRGTVFLLDGVGGYRLTPSLARVAFRQAGFDIATYFYNWHRGIPGEMLLDLTCLRANRRAALRLARIIRRRSRAYPNAPLHVLSYSGGTGIATFAAEKLGRRTRLNTLVLAASALSPEYPMAEALRHVRTCYALTSRRDVGLLGLGTTLFGTVDRQFGRAAGLRGFHNVPSEAGSGEYGRFVELPWTEDLCALGHAGHHVGAASVPYIREQIVPLLCDAS